MMWSCFGSSTTPVPENASKSRNEDVSFGVSAQLKDSTVRIVHAGGRVEMYNEAIPASRMIRKYPGTFVARPSVFKRPHESLLSADDVLLPGNKYFIIRSTTVEKLKRRHERKSRGDCDEIEEVSVCCSSGEFFVPEDNWSVLRKHAKGKGKEKRQFVPPIQRPRIWREHEWEPSLNSIQEVSP
ncbi:hypothetical protein ACP275_05G019900 [Erythranthe tilingii]